MSRVKISRAQIRELAKKAHASRLAEAASDHEAAGDLTSPTSTQAGITRRRIAQIIREERGAYSMSQYVDSESDVDTLTRRPELQAILDAANAAHGVVPYRVLKDFFWSLNSTYATKRKIMEGLDEAMADDTPIRNLNMTKLLSQYLRNEFESRTVAGFAEGKRMKISKRQLIKIIKEAQFGRFTGGAAPLDVPMRDSGPVPKDQLRKLAHIFINDMGMSPEEVLSKPEFAEQGITDLKQIEESKTKISKRQLRSIIKEAIQGGGYSTVIVMSPTGDSVLVDGQEVDPRSIAYELEVASGQSVPADMARDLENRLMSQMRTGYVEMPVSWSPDTGWKL